MIYEIIDTRTGERAKAYELVQEPWAEKVRGCDWPALAIDEDGDVMLTDDCGNYDMVPEGRVELRMVVDREKWKPCEHCGGSVPVPYKEKEYPGICNFEVGLDGGDEIAVIAYNHYTSVTTEICFSFQVAYCPKCGRPLTDAAWAELEKKIRGCVE